jgi:hypothetical protein
MLTQPNTIPLKMKNGYLIIFTTRHGAEAMNFG